jgi:hypothetical protein
MGKGRGGWQCCLRLALPVVRWVTSNYVNCGPCYVRLTLPTGTFCDLLRGDCAQCYVTVTLHLHTSRADVLCVGRLI